MLGRSLTSCAAAGAVVVLYGLYHWLVTPVVTPPHVLQKRSQQLLIATRGRLERPAENVRRARQYLARWPWTAAARCMLRHQDVFVYSQEWTPDNTTGTVTLRPFVLLSLERPGTDDERPLTVYAEAAVIRFAGGFDLKHPDPGLPVAGRLVGDVRVRGPDGLELTGRNFVYSQEALRIWSDHAIAFAFQGHRGTAEGVQLDLLPSSRPGDDLPVVGVRQVRLRRSVRLWLKHDDKDTTGPVRVQCRRGAVFDLERYRLTFAGAVSVLRPTGETVDAIRDAETLVLELAAAGRDVPGIPLGSASDVRNSRLPLRPSAAPSLLRDSAHTSRAGAFLSVPESVPLPAAHGTPANPNPAADRWDRSRRSAPPRHPGLDLSGPSTGRAAPFFPDELTRMLAVPSESAGDGPAPPTGAGRFVLPSTRLVFQQLTATGPAISVESGSNTLTALASAIVYDAVRRLVRLEGVETQTAGWSGRLVKLTHRSGELYARSAVFGLDAKNHVRTAFCRGPGWLDHRRTPDGPPALHLEWTRHLRKDIQRDGGELVEVDGEALAEVPGQRAGVIADVIRVHFQPPTGSRDPAAVRLKQIVADGRVAVAHPRLEARTDRLRIDLVEPPTGPSPANAAASSGRSADGWTLPAEERSQENASPVLYVDAGTIVLGIRPLPDGRWQLQNVVTEDAVRVTYGPREPSPPLEATAATYGPSLGENAALGTSSSAVSGLTDPSGSIVRHAAWPAGTGGQPNVATDAARDTPLSFEVLGERLSIDNASDPRAQLLSVSGSPAQLRTPEARLSGPLILFDRRRAEAHVHGAGVLQILADEVDLSGVLAATPSAAGETPGHNPSDKPSRTPLRRTGPNRAATDATLAGRRPATDAPDDAAADTTDSDRWLTIRWQEEMRFDGRQADFFGDVRATLQTFHMRCQEMAVTLDQPLQVFQTDAEPLRTVAAPPPSPVARHGAQDHSQQTWSAADRPQIERVVCREAVAFDAYQYHNGALAGVRKVHCGRFEFHRGSGAFRVRGPGRILNWSREDDQPHPVLGSVRAQANQPLQAEQAEWQFVRIDFAGEAHGNVQERFTTFLDRVRVVYGPVDDPRTELDPERLPPSGIELTADALDAFLPQARHGDDTLQLLARGNVKLAGRSFFARAETVSYDDAKGLFVLTARGDQPAAIWRQKVFGSEYSRAEARRMEFNPSRNELRMFGIVGAQGQP